MVLLAALVFSPPVCVVGRVFTPPGTMSKVIVNVANAAKRLVKFPPNPDGGFMMFLDPGVYTYRLVSAKGNTVSGPLGSFTVTEGKLTRICVQAAPPKAGFGRLEGTVDVPGMKGPIPNAKWFKTCSVSVSSPGSTTKTASAAVWGIFSVDLKPGTYDLNANFKAAVAIKATVVAGNVGSVSISTRS